MKFINFLKGIKENIPKYPVDQTNFTVHNDIKDLIWIKNGPKKNYNTNKYKDPFEFEVGGISYTFNISSGSSEPSAIDTKLPISRNVNKTKVSGLSYFPAYSSLSPEQRAVYLEYLSTPYDPSYEIGYVFLLYYGLERFLIGEKFEDAFCVISKLREVHKNGSFQYYSGNALILACIYNQRPDIMLSFIESAGEEYKLKFSDNLFLLSAYSFMIPLKSIDIIRLSKTFEFTNKRYISKYPDMFNETMIKLINKKYDRDSILLNDVLKKSDFDKVKTEKMRMFANISISEKEIDVPLISESFIIKKTFYDLLEETHETVKVELAELRKKGKTPTPKKKKKTKNKTVLTFDKIEERNLLNQLKNTKNNVVDRHFVYMSLQNFYYKFRELDNKYIDECIKYCKEDINSLNELQKKYINSELNDLKKLSSFYEEDELNERISEAREGFQGRIPAFERLAIIYEKKKQYNKALEICDAAIEYYEKLNMNETVDGFIHRKTRVLNKKSKI